MDAKDLQRRWKEVVATSGTELHGAPPSDKLKWKRAQQEAEKVVAALEPVIKAEKLACAAWQKARQVVAAKPKPMLQLVR
jgi:hypothetical protein